MGSFEISRGQIPVGQGCFSFGEISDFSSGEKKHFLYIHDCGGEMALIKDSIDNNVLPNRKINALFLSHFDEDHVKGIKYLLSKRTVERVYIPLLDEVNKIVLLAACIARGKLTEGLKTFIEDPKKWFAELGAETVIEIDPETPPSDDPEILIIDGEGLRSVISPAASTGKITISVSEGSAVKNIWQLKAFSYVDQDKSFLTKFKKYFKSSLKTDKNIRKWLLEKADPNEVKKFMVEIGETDHNRISLCLFSGPLNGIKRKWPCFVEIRGNYRAVCDLPSCISCVSGWLHTADYPFRTVKCKKKFKEYFKNDLNKVRYFMLSHHGADLDFKPEILGWMPDMKFAIVPVGPAGKKYRHPGEKALRQVLLERIEPVLVMDKKEDIFLVQECFSY